MNIVTHHKPQLRLRLNRRIVLSAVITFATLGLTAASASLHAQQNEQSSATGKTDKNVINVIVEATAEDPGRFTMSGDEINQAPSTSSTFLDALRSKASIQFDLNSRNSETAGDITPPRISINGAKHYENNFLIDGVSNNNNINPGGFQSNAGDSPGVAPAGEDQSLFINPDLIGALTVYTSNVPVSYGRFTGGVINAKIRDPRTDGFHGSLLYRYTSNAWADQRFIQGESEDYTTSDSHQPLFKIYTFNINIETPLSAHIAALLDYSEVNSNRPIWDNTVPAVNYINTSNNKNVILKFITYNLNSFTAKLTATYSPFEKDMRIASRRDNLSATDGGGIKISLDAEKLFSFAKWTSIITYNKSDLSRIGSSDEQFSWRNSPNNSYADWGTSTAATATAQEGSLGYYKQTVDSYVLKSEMAFVTIGPKLFKNTFKVGGEVSANRVKRDTSGATLYMWNTTDPVTKPGPLNPNAVGEKSNGVISGEQWLNRRTLYDSTDKILTYTEAAFFIEDVIKIERVTLRPGFRLDYEDLVENTNLAPRIFANVDTFKNGLLNLSAGASRYYGSQLLSAALYNNQGFRTERRKSWDAPWTLYTPASDSAATRRLGDLDTPYADELSLAASLYVHKTLFRIEGVTRKSRDQIRSMRDPLGTSAARVSTNSGRTDYRGLILEIEKDLNLGRGGTHDISFGIKWQRTESNSRVDDSYDENDAGVYSPDWALYNGQMVLTDNLPASNFNSPLVSTLKITSDFLKKRLRFFNSFRYEKGGDGVWRSNTPNVIGPDGKRVYVYTERAYSDSFFWDMTVAYDLLKFKSNVVTLMLNVNNVLNRYSLVNTGYDTSTQDTYTLGRQFKAVIQYKF